MSGWLALGRCAEGVRACVMAAEGRLVETVLGESEEAVLAGLQAVPGTVLRIGEGKPARLPARMLPETGRSLPGFSQDSPPDAIGAWVRLWIAGFLSRHPNWDGVICATQGDVRHWIHVSAGEAVSAQSFLTPRLVGALGGGATPDRNALADSLSRPERLAAHLRAAEVSGRPGAVTGHLIGAELAAARAYWLGQRTAVIAAPPAPMADALAAQGVPCTVHDPDSLIGPGLAVLGKALHL